QLLVDPRLAVRPPGQVDRAARLPHLLLERRRARDLPAEVALVGAAAARQEVIEDVLLLEFDLRVHRVRFWKELSPLPLPLPRCRMACRRPGVSTRTGRSTGSVFRAMSSFRIRGSVTSASPETTMSMYGSLIVCCQTIVGCIPPQITGICLSALLYVTCTCTE